MLEFGDMAIAGMGVAMKVVTITGMISMGLGQGVQALLGYSIGARNWDRYNKILKFSLCFALILSIILTNALQAMGDSISSLIINISRQGIIFIPAVFILKEIIGLNGVVWAKPVADVISIILALGLYIFTFKKIKKKLEESNNYKEEIVNG